MEQEFDTTRALGVSLAVAFQAASSAAAQLAGSALSETTVTHWPALGGDFDVGHFDALGAFVRANAGSVSGEAIHRWAGGRGLHQADPNRYGETDGPVAAPWLVAHEVFAASLPLVDRVHVNAASRLAVQRVAEAGPVLAAALLEPVDDTTLAPIAAVDALVEGVRAVVTSEATTPTARPAKSAKAKS